MLVKEYRIPLPLTVEEYKIAQLYMIARKSRSESEGSGSGVEIIQNEPYEDGPGGSGGQYTYKIYHITAHLPAWLSAILPKSAIVEEKAWNAYPYTKTRYTCPFIEKFSIQIETRYYDDCGCQENVFNLPASELCRQVDVIDIVKEAQAERDVAAEEDPRMFKSVKTGRGPLEDNWIDKCWQAKLKGDANCQIMCAYKLCRVEFKYWGMQSKIEKYIHDSALRKTMAKAHQQAWIWQDEWVGMTMEDIRKLEYETQEYLRRHMAGEEELLAEEEAKQEVDSSGSSITKKSSSQYSLAKPLKEGDELSLKRKSSQWSRANSKSTLYSPATDRDVMQAWRIQTLQRDSDEDEDDEFYDAEDNHTEEEEEDVGQERLDAFEYADSEDSIFSSKFIKRAQTNLLDLCKSASAPMSNYQQVEPPSPSSPIQAPTCSYNTLLIVIHGGSVLDISNDHNTARSLDVATLKNTLESIVNQYYSNLIGRIKILCVACPSICRESMTILASLSPFVIDTGGSQANVQHSFSSIPTGALPLFATSSLNYEEHISTLINQCNKAYHDFLKSAEGQGFKGKVALIGDSVGAILGFDALCHSNARNNVPSDQSSLHDLQEACASKSSTPVISVSECELGEDGHTRSKYSTMPLTASSTANKSEIKPKMQIYCKSLSHPGDASAHESTSNRLEINNTLRRRSSGSNSEQSSTKLDFEVHDFFMLGSMIGVVLTYRKMLSFDDKSFTLMKPACTNLYNLFHLTDPSALRIEPLLSARFSSIAPINVPRFQKFPLGDGQPIHLLEYLQTNAHLFESDHHHSKNDDPVRCTSESSLAHNLPIDVLNHPNMSSLIQRWYSTKRIDYALYSPEGLNDFPSHALPHLFHASYWESLDAVSFILRQINKGQVYASSSNTNTLDNRQIFFKPNQPREKWQRKRTSVKIKNITANHRANDVIVKEGLEQCISGRFMYGPFDVIALSGEKVDIHMRCSSTGDWIYLATGVTDKNGRVVHTIPKEKSLPVGLYQFKMNVRGDHTCLDLFMAVVPPKSEVVVFSIDGSLTASVSVSGRDPKVRAGAIDVVRFWQELGFVIIYITGRPDIQQQRVVSWLSQHNFPHGLIFFAEGISTDPLKHKAENLRNLKQKMEVVFKCAYGSSKDISVYQSLDIKPENIYAVGKVSKKQSLQANVLVNGYTVHLEELKMNTRLRPPQVNARILLPKGGFSGLRSRQMSQKLAKRTISYPLGKNLSKSLAGDA